MIKKSDDGQEAKEAAKAEADRIMERIRYLEANKMHSAAESLQRRWESADLDSKTWGEVYLRLKEIAR